MESSLLRRGAGTSSSTVNQMRAMGGASVGLGGATSGHARAASPPAVASQGHNDGNINKVWMHGTKLAGQGFKCGYCGTVNKGGGATRFRDHLGCIVGEVKSCTSVPRDVRDAMRELRKTSMENKREKKERMLRLERDLMQGVQGQEVVDLASDEEDQVRLNITQQFGDKNLSRAIERRCGSGKGVCVSVGKSSVTAYFDKDLSRNKAPVQPRIDTVLQVGSREKLADWWFQFGGEVPTLQKYALRIVSQCVSSSGCERNWSTFALVHTKIRNKLGYDKLHKLVYVHYNLKERIREDSGYQQKDKEVDPCSMMLDAAIFDEKNPIWDWLDRSMNDVGPSLADLCRSQLGNSSHGKRARMDLDVDEIEFELGESDEEQNEDGFEEDLAEDDDTVDIDDDSSDGEGEPVVTAARVEDREALGEEDGNPNGRRSGRLQQKKMRTQSLSTLYERE